MTQKNKKGEAADPKNPDADGPKFGEDPTKSQIFYPVAKTNIWDEQQGFGSSAYLFDYLDDVFQKLITTEFAKMWDAATKIKPDATVKEPYTLQNMVFYMSQQTYGKPGTSNTEKELMEHMKKVRPNFNDKVWGLSLDIQKLSAIITTWGWRKPSGDGWQKTLIDRYDFDGDGRLNPSEFIMLSVIQNKNYFNDPECKQFCYKDILKDYLVPIFAFLDCDGDGWIDAENIWLGLEKLKRSKKELYDIYKCRMPVKLNTGYRTDSCNDFVLKNHSKKKAFLNKIEFATGIILGYWSRNTSNEKIIPNDEATKKTERWGNGGKDDLICAKVLKLIATKTVQPVSMFKKSG